MIINLKSVASMKRITHILINMPQSVRFFFILQLMKKCLVMQGTSLFPEVPSVTEIETNYNNIMIAVGRTKTPRRIF